jgi:hypothetical protein
MWGRIVRLGWDSTRSCSPESCSPESCSPESRVRSPGRAGRSYRGDEEIRRGKLVLSEQLWYAGEKQSAGPLAEGCEHGSRALGWR